MGIEEDIQALSLLLKASSKKLVLELCRDVHKHICDQTPVSSINKKVMGNLSLTETEASQLTKALHNLIQQMLFHNWASAEEIGAYFPESFHNNLKDLLVRILVECSSQWRTECLNNTVSLPRLQEFNYRVDWKMAPDSTDQLNIPTCILDLQVSHCISDSPELLSVELTREKLDTMLHGLGRIRDQLSAVAKK